MVPVKVSEEGRMEGMKETSKLDDRLLHCLDRGADFTFTFGEQRYFFSKGLSQPKRCPECRLKRRLSLIPDKGAGR